MSKIDPKATDEATATPISMPKQHAPETKQSETADQKDQPTPIITDYASL